MVKKSSLLAYANKVKGGTDLKPRKIIARIAGVTFEGRQEKIAHIKSDTQIKLERDRRNEYDFYAVKVLALLNGTWEHVGFLPKTMSRNISKSLDEGVALNPSVHKVKGGYSVPASTMGDEYTEKLNYGLDICIEGLML